MQALADITIEEIKDIMNCDESLDIVAKNIRVFGSDQIFQEIDYNDTA